MLGSKFSEREVVILNEVVVLLDNAMADRRESDVAKH